MRVYIPTLRKTTGLFSSCVFTPDQSFCSAWPFSDWGMEDYEDLAMSYASMFSLGMELNACSAPSLIIPSEEYCPEDDAALSSHSSVPGQIKEKIWSGRIVLAADISAKQLGDKLALPGAYHLASLNPQQIVSYHIEEPALLSLAESLRTLPSPLIKRLVSTPEEQALAYEELLSFIPTPELSSEQNDFTPTPGLNAEQANSTSSLDISSAISSYLSAENLSYQEQWDTLLGESLLWYDRSESEAVLKATNLFS